MHKEIFENLLLTEEVKTQLSEAFTTAIATQTAVLEAEYKEKEEQVQETVLETVQAMVADTLSEELDLLAEELDHARSLDVHYAEKLEEFKESYAAAQQDTVRVLVAESVAEEIDELREDVEFAKKNAFGVQIYEAFRDMYDVNFAGADVDVVAKLRESEEKLEQYQRDEKINELLEGIGGRERTVLTTLLEGVAVEKLESRFNSVKSIVLREATTATAPIVENDKGEPVVNAQIIVEGVEKNDELTAAFNRALSLGKRKIV